MATQVYYPEPLLTAEQFLAIEFGPDVKAELDNGVIRMMAGGTSVHARVQGNVFAFLRGQLRGSGCRPYNSDMAVRTHGKVRSVIRTSRSIVRKVVALRMTCSKHLSDHLWVFEILSNGTARTDLKVKLVEYRALPSVDTIVFVDAIAERVRVVQRTAANAWSDVEATSPLDVALPSLDLTIPHAEIFARD